VSDGIWRQLPEALGAGELDQFRRVLPGAVAVTGATGFLGSHLVDALVAVGLRPRVLVRDPRRLRPAWGERVETIAGDLDDRSALERLVAGCAAILHLAGLVRAADPRDFSRVNGAGTQRLVDAWMTKAPTARLVYVSSLAAAGPSDSPSGRAPDEPPSPVSAYGRSKLAGEEAVRCSHGHWSIVRPPAIYGPRDIDVFQFFRLASRGLVPLPRGERFITVAYVADVVRAVVGASDLAPGLVVHVGEPRPYPLSDLIRILAREGGVRCRQLGVPGVVVRLLGRFGDALHGVGFRSVAMTSDKAAELLAAHWSARTEDSLRLLGLDGFVPFAAGARSTWAWYREKGWLPPARAREREGREPA
jgi:nucleoside-diphosphate-sugar epimerase